MDFLILKFIIVFLFCCLICYCKCLYEHCVTMRETVKQTKLQLTNLENQISSKNKQINSYFFNFQQKNSCISELLTIVMDIERSLPAGKKDILKELKANVKNSLVLEKKWDDFHSYFEESQVDANAVLLTKHPDLKPNDLKICSLIRLNLPIKESANILGISPDSLKTSRYRLRKKLGIEPKQNIVKYLICLEKEHQYIRRSVG